MSDDELRALERDLSAPSTRVRYAEALARLGRAEEALAALLPAIEVPVVRAAARRLERPPVALDAKPSVLWRFGETMEDLGALHANAFAVVASVHNISHSWPPYVGGAPESLVVQVLDAATGVRRASLGGFECLGLVDEVVVAREDKSSAEVPTRVAGFDARDGRELWSLVLGPISYAHLTGRTLVVQRGWTGSANATKEGLSLDDPRVAPSHVCPIPVEPAGERRLLRVGAWSCEMREDGVIARRDGKETWRVPWHEVGTAYTGLLVHRGARIVGAYARGGAVFCLG